MASKVLVKLPTVPFPQGKKPPPELVSLPNRNEGTAQTRHQRFNGDRTAQLEQNMKFLQEQHQATLVALHQEVETLRQRNRDLQFQLVFSKGSNVSSTASSPEDSGNGFTKAKGSPAYVNVTPLQVELLEKDLQDIKTSLNESKTHNIHLSEIIEKQKKILELTDVRAEKLAVKDVGVQIESGPDAAQVDLATRLEDAEAMVKRLRRENEDQRREMATMKATLYNGNGSGSGRNRGPNNGHHYRSSQGEGDEHNSHKFPPLQTQSYWHRGSRGNHSFDHNSEYHRNGRSRVERQDREPEVDSTVLPQLRNGAIKSDNSTSYPPFYRSRGYLNGGGNYHRDGGNRKYRGHRQQRDRRESEPRDHRREYKEREYPEAVAEGSRDSKSIRRQ
ncbi:uncharacterized protein LOC117174507 [Belonocnema kinseyi]|uniref:uncharacterized protein LOC117174507 n=1 Tax=Belonocnema kinseyi TaxID=2817044 RepID=UPI00143E0187|nr:uncharacterized protein LOC117174507 [Belonocnema kinseyi]XP_033219579.1 uncharacterized protein LOC117174507 [Belonocnema kinseyi]XP_033219580.1 uncharacterized protein LOC117174507 [Belonocnema kinseyi]